MRDEPFVLFSHRCLQSIWVWHALSTFQRSCFITARRIAFEKCLVKRCRERSRQIETVWFIQQIFMSLTRGHTVLSIVTGLCQTPAPVFFMQQEASDWDTNVRSGVINTRPSMLTISQLASLLMSRNWAYCCPVVNLVDTSIYIERHWLLWLAHPLGTQSFGVRSSDLQVIFQV